MNEFPVFRLTVFLAAGIFLTESLQLNDVTLPLVLAVGLLVVLGYMVRHCTYGYRWLFGVLVACLMALIGIVLTCSAGNHVRCHWPDERRMYVGTVGETPVEKSKIMQCRVMVADKDVLLSVYKDSLSRSLCMGEELRFYARIESPRSSRFSTDFDYGRYLYHQGISGTAYLPARSWSKTGRMSELSWKQQAMRWREVLMDCFRQWGIGEGQLPVLSALTLGHKKALDKDTREAYSKAGIAHVLALSGMHMGILWLLLDLLFRPIGRIRRLRWLPWVLVTAMLWGFAFLVGLEASVVRAVVMCMLMGVGRLTTGKFFSMNTLSVAAFFMLLFHPFYLFDVGFQLSFAAVASILYLYRPIFESLPLKNRLLRWGWRVMSVSMAAQLGTAPLVMYYFSTFSVYFLLANLVVAVMVPLLIYGTVLMFVSAPFPWVQQGVAGVLNGLVQGMNGLAFGIGAWPGSTFGWPDLHPLEIIAFYACLMSGWKYGKTRRRKWLIRTLALCVCLLLLHLGLYLFG